MKIGIKVGDVMTRQLVSVTPSENVIDCAKKMAGQDVGLIIVKKGGKLSGVLTERALIWALTKKGNLKNVRASDIMLRKINTIKPSRDIYEALLRMKKQKTRWLPITVNGRVIGILTINDILRIEPGLFELVRGNMNIREAENKLHRSTNGNGGNWHDEGECDRCGAYDLLQNYEGELVCEGCHDNIQPI